jgi:ribosomal protein L37AE/L43A
MKRKKRRRRSAAAADDDASYTCPTCGESIVIPLDPTGGAEQQYVEDCPVCCNPNVIHVEFFGEGEPPRLWAEAE